MITALERDNLLPAILFRSSRKQCDRDIEFLCELNSACLAERERRALRLEIGRVIEKYGVEPDVIHSHIQYEALVQTGAGAHHAGQLLVWRLLLEELMSRGVLRLMVATGTVAAGVDFPARSVIVTAHSRRGAEGFRVCSAAEFQQMSGRAGRRGKDTVGFCLMAPSPFCDARILHEVAGKPAEPLRSAYFASPSTVLNLLRYRNVDDLYYTVSRSLATFIDRKQAKELRRAIALEECALEDNTQVEGQDSAQRKQQAKRIRRRHREADELERRQEQLLAESLRGLTRLAFVAEGTLTDKGYWASKLCTNLVLELGETINDGLLNDLDTKTLAALVASLAGDPHRTYFGIRDNPIKKEYFDQLREILNRVDAAYTKPPLISPVAVLPDAALTVLMWLEAEEWSEYSSLLRLAGVAEGDAARLITQTGEQLNQIGRLTESHVDLAHAAEEARRQLLRPPVVDGLEIRVEEEREEQAEECEGEFSKPDKVRL